MQNTIRIQLSDSLTGWAKFNCRAFGVNYYHVGLMGSSRYAEVKWPDGGNPSCSYADGVGLTEGQACLLARHFEQREYENYVQWHNQESPRLGLGPVQPQERGLVMV